MSELRAEQNLAYDKSLFKDMSRKVRATDQHEQKARVISRTFGNPETLLPLQLQRLLRIPNRILDEGERIQKERLTQDLAQCYNLPPVEDGPFFHITINDIPICIPMALLLKAGYLDPVLPYGYIPVRLPNGEIMQYPIYDQDHEAALMFLYENGMNPDDYYYKTPDYLKELRQLDYNIKCAERGTQRK